MSRGGIILQPLLFDPGVVVALSPVPPPPAGGGAAGGGTGGSLLPILGGLLLFFAAFGFPPAATSPSPLGPRVTSPGPVSPPVAPQPGSAPAPGLPPVAQPPATPPYTQAPPVAAPAATPGGPPAVERPSRHARGMLSTIPRLGSPESNFRRAGPAGPSRRRRPVLPFTGANLVSPMAAGLGLILLGLVLRRVRHSAQSP